MAKECQDLAASFSDEQAAEGLIITDKLRTIFQRPAATSSSVAGPANPARELLSIVPPELLSIIMSQLGTRALACLAATCSSLWRDTPTPQATLPPGLVETELRRRAEARGLHIGRCLPAGALSRVSYLLKRDVHDALRREASLAVGDDHSIFADREGRLHLACRSEKIKAGKVGEPLLGHDWGWDAGASASLPPTLVSSLQDKRIVSVVTGCMHCLALSAEGEVYSWGDGTRGALGQADGSARAGPRRIETLTRVESVAAGPDCTSAAVDDRGRLFTWGRGSIGGEPAGLGYALNPGPRCQLLPKRVDALSKDRVVSVSLGYDFTLAVTDVGAVFSFGHSGAGALGHGSLGSEVLPRRIEALAGTGQRFVAVAAGYFHSLALTEEGEVYRWGAAGHEQSQQTPQRVTTLAGVRVVLVYAVGNSSCAVTKKGELYTWGESYYASLGHGVDAWQQTPKRVEALSRVKVAAVAMCNTHTLVAGADGVVWAFGKYGSLGLGDADALTGSRVMLPTPDPNLRVRTLR